MTDYISSPNMSLFLPIPGVAPGPNYAFEQNASFSLVDSHDHSPGKGVKVNPAGLNINADLSFIGNNAINLRSVRFSSQVSPLALVTDIGCLYESGVDLYYNDGFGTQIRITQSGGIAGTPGSISGLSPPASVSYVALSETFIFQSDVNTPANIDVASVILRNLSANSNGLTLNPPNAMASNYSLTLPLLPNATKIMTLSASGAMAGTYILDNSTIVSDAGTLKVPAGGITSTQLADGSVIASKIPDASITRAKLVPVGRGISSSCGSFTTTNGTATAVTNLSVTITTAGGPVYLAIIADGTGSGDGGGAGSSVGLTNHSGIDNSIISFWRDASVIANYSVAGFFESALGNITTLMTPPTFIDAPVAGTYTYSVKAAIFNNSSSSSANVTNCKLLAYEMY